MKIIRETAKISKTEALVELYLGQYIVKIMLLSFSS